MVGRKETNYGARNSKCCQCGRYLFRTKNQRNDQQELLPHQICTSLEGLTSKLGPNTKDTRQIKYNRGMMEKRMDEKDKKLEVEFGNGIDSVARQCE